mgnify:CR=1 FL=1
MNEFLMAFVFSWMVNGVILIGFCKKMKDFISLVGAITFLICYFFKDFSTLDYSFILFILWYIIFDIIFENITNVVIKKYKRKEN